MTQILETPSFIDVGQIMFMSYSIQSRKTEVYTIDDTVCHYYPDEDLVTVGLRHCNKASNPSWDENSYLEYIESNGRDPENGYDIGVSIADLKNLNDCIPLSAKTYYLYRYKMSKLIPKVTYSTKFKINIITKSGLSHSYTEESNKNENEVREFLNNLATTHQALI